MLLNVKVRTNFRGNSVVISVISSESQQVLKSGEVDIYRQKRQADFVSTVSVARLGHGSHTAGLQDSKDMPPTKEG